MADKASDRRGLGRGLSTLLADVQADDGAGDRPRDMRTMPIDQIVPNPDQPRRSFNDEALDELAASIREKGVIQPLIVRKARGAGDRYEIVAGERRWRASQRANLHELPVIVRSFDDDEVLEIAIVENIQRADLNPVDEAAGYRQLMDRFGRTQEQMSDALGKSRSHIANLLRLLNLPEEVREMIARGELSAGHARALIPTEDPVAMAHRVVAQRLSVRQTEQLAKGRDAGPPRSRRRQQNADISALEGDLAATLGMKVGIDHADGAGGGRLTIDYRSLDDLDALCRLLSGATGDAA